MEERLREDKSLEVCLVCETTSSSTWSEEEKNERFLYEEIESSFTTYHQTSCHFDSA